MAVTQLTNLDFEEHVLKSDIPVLVDFWAPWCGPCRMVAPMIEELASEYEGRAKFYKVNVDDNEELARKYRIMSIPAVYLFNHGQVVEKSVGLKPKIEFIEMLDGEL